MHGSARNGRELGGWRHECASDATRRDRAGCASREERLPELVERLGEGVRDVVGERPGLGELGEDLRPLGLEEAIEAGLEVLDPWRRDVVELAGGGGVQDRDLLLDWVRLV